MRFLDIYMPVGVKGFPAVSAPRFSTTLVESDSGDEDANENWQHPLHTFRLPKLISNMAVFNALRAHWYNTKGPARTFPFRDPLDFASVDLECANTEPAISLIDQVIGEGDGLTKDFQLIKTYTAGAYSYSRTIQLPIVSSVLIGLDGDTPAAASGGPYVVTVTREGGNVNINPAPGNGVAITAGFLFDVPVRFESDDTLEGVVQSMQVNGFSDLTLIERRLC